VTHSYRVSLVRNNGDIELTRVVKDYASAEKWARLYGARLRKGALRYVIRNETVHLDCRDKRFSEVSITIEP